MRVSTSRLTIFAAAAVLAGCGGSKPTPPPEPTQEPAIAIQPGAPGEPSREVVVTPTPAGGGFVHADVEFMQGMIHHHQQALVMTGYVPKRTQSTSVRLLSRRMEVSQTDEITLMRNWLKSRGVDPDDHSHEHAAMPGMLTSTQLARLEQAGGGRFDRLFLRYMIQHHHGALTMVRQLQDKGGGNESEIGVFSLHVESDQAIEIERMQGLLRVAR